MREEEFTGSGLYKTQQPWAMPILDVSEHLRQGVGFTGDYANHAVLVPGPFDLLRPIADGRGLCVGLLVLRWE
jgi:hypothetical protein